MTTRISIATVTVPAQLPKSRTDAKTNVSETERRAGIDGILIVNDPVNSVSTASTSHSFSSGCWIRVLMQWPTISSPAAETHGTYTCDFIG